MRWFTLIVIVTATVAGCSDQPAGTDDANWLERVLREQSQGLTDATVVVHRAYEYHGYSWLEPVDAARLIAVDVEFRNYNQGLDLHDVEVINGESDENYGSEPQTARLTLDGKPAFDSNASSWRDKPGPLRVLLIYAYPKASNSIKLGYWGQVLTPEPIPIVGDGPSLPKPTPSDQGSAA